MKLDELFDMAIVAHEVTLEMHGGSVGLRDESLLYSALAAPFQTFAEIDLYPSVCEKAGRLAFGIIKNHPFVDGNKRTAVMIMLDFLDINGIDLTFKQSELQEIIEDVAAGIKTHEELVEWINCHKK